MDLAKKRNWKKRYTDILGDFYELKQFTHDGYPLIRYSEMVLSAAEANARLYNTSDALILSNGVRSRALASPLTQAYTNATSSTPADLVRPILKERRIEFICEGRRWGDIHRLFNDDIEPTNGIISKFANDFPPVGSYVLATPYTGLLIATIALIDRRFYGLYSLQETNNNPILKAQQNFGY